MCLPTVKDTDMDVPLPPVIPQKKIVKPLRQCKASPLGILPDVPRPIEPKPLHLTPSVHHRVYSHVAPGPVLIHTTPHKH